MRIWIISDTHIGVKNNSKEWLGFFENYFHSSLLPLLREEVKEGDWLIHCGDVFDNRSTIGLNTMNFTISLFEELAEIFNHQNIKILCGNHDIYQINDNEITSLACLQNIKGVEVVRKPGLSKVGDVKVGLIPWVNNAEDFKKWVKEYQDCKYLFCHVEFKGTVMNASGVKADNGVELSTISHISHVFSGHIHHRQTTHSLTYIGSPYHLTQNDRNNERGVYSIDLANDEVKFYKNTISPKFMRFSYDDVKNMKLKEFKSLCYNTFTEVLVGGDLYSKINFQKIYNSILPEHNIKDLSFKPTTTVLKDELTPSVLTSEYLSMEEMIDKYVDERLDYNDKFKTNIKTISKKLIHV